MNRTLTTEYTQLTEQEIASLSEITVLYARLSKDDGKKTGDSDSIVNQKILLTTYAKNEDLGNCVLFADDGISGTTFNRPAFQAAIDLVEQGKVATFVVKDLSRFGRDYLKVGAFTEVVFPEKNVRFIAINDNVDSNHPDDNSLAPFRNLFNEWYARDTSKKIKAVKHAKGNAGEPIGGSLPYGYIKGENYKKTKIWLVDEKAAKVVRRIYKECIEGKSLLGIADGLEADKILIPSRHKMAIGENVASKGKFPYRWGFDVIRNILTSQVYLGCVISFKTYKKSYKSKKCLPNPHENWVITPGHHEAIIDQATFDLAQKLRKTALPRRNSHKRIGLFSGLVFCADCGYKHHYDDRRGHPSYYCSGRTRLGSCLSYHRIRESELMRIVSESFKTLQEDVNDKNGEFVAQLRLKFAADENVKRADTERKFLQNQERISELDDVISRLYEDNVSGKISDERFHKMNHKFEAEQEELSAENLIFREKMRVENEATQKVDQFLELAKQAANLENLTDQNVRKLLERIEISEKVKDEMGETTQKVRLFYRFVGEI